MSEQRRERQELRQGLHQFLMQMYQSYLETQSEEEAKKIVAETIQEQYNYFRPGLVAQDGVAEVIEQKIASLDALMKGQSDYDGQLFYAEKIDALQEALDIIKNY